ncbi:MAG TPA: DUF6266 family protein [Pseudosphingobacterium sp.]|nr:DUF6266 family protein [Pseudosphingobacterium sp.]
MATYSQGANGAFSGKAGSVVGSNWRSIGYLRGLARFKTKSNSPKQAAQRARFGMAVTFLRPMKNILNIGFHDRRSNKSTGYNQGMQSFMRHAITGEYPDFEIDFSKIEVSKGGLEKLLGLSVVSDQANTLSITWQDTSETSDNAYLDDQVFVLIYNQTEDIFTTYKNAQRQDAGIELELPEMFSGNEFHVYVFVLDRDGRDASNSQYGGVTVLS